jgi:hypothetical protein
MGDRAVVAMERDEIGRRLDPRDADLVLDGKAQHPAIPAEVVLPDGVGDLVERLPCLLPERGLVPGAEGQRGDAERRAGQRLGRAQRIHAGIGDPGSFAARRIAIDQPDVADAAQGQRARRRQAAHAGTDHRHVYGPAAVRPHCRRRPGGGWQAEQGEVAMNCVVGWGAEH